MVVEVLIELLSADIGCPKSAGKSEFVLPVVCEADDEGCSTFSSEMLANIVADLSDSFGVMTW